MNSYASDVDPLFYRAVIFECPHRNAPIGLRPFENLEPSLRNRITEHFTLRNEHGFTYFDFSRSDEVSTVIFAEAIRDIEGDSLSRRDGIIFAEIGGNLYYVWLSVGEVHPNIVAPFVYYNRNLIFRPALLVTISHVASYGDVLFLTFESGNLRVQWLHPQDER